MNTVNIKPLSVNEVWQGRRFKTSAYLSYEKALLFLLPHLKVGPPPFRVTYELGMSNKRADPDNPIKPLQDVLCKKYKFDDKDIYEIHIKKVVVQKGKEYIKFQIESI